VISLLMSGSFVHKIIIAGCRCFASPLPSGPHQEGHHAEGRSPDHGIDTEEP
jgi:hypothetical protein